MLNEKGQFNPLEKIQYGILLVFGILMFVLIATPLIAILSDSAIGLNNTGIFYMGGATLILVQLIAAFLVITGLIGLLSPSSPQYQPPRY